MMRKKITIKDIAFNCGVGLGTASRAINGQPGVRDEIRKQIFHYIEEIGWRSNNVKSRLTLPHAEKTVIFISSKELLDNDSDTTVPRAIMDGLSEKGFENLMMLGSCSELLQKVAAYHPYGVVVLGMADFLVPHIKELLNKDIRVVSIGEIKNFEGALLHPDHRKVARDAARLLYDAGHRKIGFFGGMGMLKELKSMDDVHILRISEMLCGFTEVLPDFNIRTDVVSDCFNQIDVLCKVLKKKNHTAWICSEERMCRLLFYAAREVGLRIPEDISLVGLTPQLPFHVLPQDVTRFEMDTPARAAKAVELLCGPPVTEKQEYKFDFILHEGATVKRIRPKI